MWVSWICLDRLLGQQILLCNHFSGEWSKSFNMFNAAYIGHNTSLKYAMHCWNVSQWILYIVIQGYITWQMARSIPFQISDYFLWWQYQNDIIIKMIWICITSFPEDTKYCCQLLLPCQEIVTIISFICSWPSACPISTEIVMFPPPTGPWVNTNTLVMAELELTTLMV